MRHDTKAAVVDVLASHQHVTAREISRHTGLAYNTVKTALSEIAAVPVGDTWPTQWRLRQDTDAIPQKMLPALEGVTIEVWNDNTWAAITDKLRPIQPADDPRDIAKNLRRIAEIVAGMALVIEENKDSPGWYLESGGTNSL